MVHYPAAASNAWPATCAKQGKGARVSVCWEGIHLMAVAVDVLNLYLLTADGLVRGRVSPELDRAEIVGRALDGEVLRGVCQDPSNPRHLVVASMTDVFASDDAGETWRWLPSGGIDYREIWSLAIHPTRPNEVYVGTLPAAVYVSENGGRSFRELSSFRNLPDYKLWTFPPPPHSAHVRWIVLDARLPDEILVGIEEGGVARSRDRGQTWEDVSGPRSREAYPNNLDFDAPYEMGHLQPGRVYRDVHVVARDPQAVERIYATTGLGTFRTDDDGASWRRLEYGMERAYAIPFVIPRGKPGRLYLCAAENGPNSWKGFRGTRPGPTAVSRYNRFSEEMAEGAFPVMLRSDDGGDTWQRTETGLPERSAHMMCALALHPSDPDTVFAAYTTGAIYATTDAGEQWTQVLEPGAKLYGLKVFAG